MAGSCPPVGENCYLCKRSHPGAPQGLYIPCSPVDKGGGACYNGRIHIKEGEGMKHYGLIGEKLGHSLSRPIHEAIFRELEINADYRIIEIPRDHFPQETRGLLEALDGFNITIPYKQDVMPLLRRIDPAAAEIGAVNTVLCREGVGIQLHPRLRRHGEDCPRLPEADGR